MGEPGSICLQRFTNFFNRITPWVTNMGLQNAFIVAGLAGMVQVLTVFFFIRYGQRMRQATVDKCRRYQEEMMAAGLVH